MIHRNRLVLLQDRASGSRDASGSEDYSPLPAWMARARVLFGDLAADSASRALNAAALAA